MNQQKKNAKINESEDLGENFTGSYSEEMSKENIPNDSYFNIPKGFIHKIICNNK